MNATRKTLLQFSSKQCQDFSKKLIKTDHKILGIKQPVLRQIAKTITLSEIEISSSISHEEVLLFGYVAAKEKTEDSQISCLKKILPQIDNWCTCDCIVGALKHLDGEKSFDFFKKLLSSKNPFHVRVGIVGLMRYFLKTKTKEVLAATINVTNQDYFVKMALAWLYCELATQNFTLAQSAISNLSDDFVRNKATSKCLDSFRLTKQQKESLKQSARQNTKQQAPHFSACDL